MPHALKQRCINIAVAIVCLLLLVALFLPHLGRARELHGRATCAANQRGIVQAMTIYALDFAGQYPAVPPQRDNRTYDNDLSGTAATFTDPNEHIQTYYAQGTASPQAGNPSACLWLLVLRNQVGARSFLCKYDMVITGSSPLTDTDNHYYTNFASPRNQSYSIAYPWYGRGAEATTGAWWRNTQDASLPVLCDMAPWHGRDGKTTTVVPGANGTPASFLPGSPPRIQDNSNFNPHPVVAFADAHVEQLLSPWIGPAQDNIFTAGSNTPVTPGIAPPIRSNVPPFDIVMVPVRDRSGNMK